MTTYHPDSYLSTLLADLDYLRRIADVQHGTGFPDLGRRHFISMHEREAAHFGVFIIAKVIKILLTSIGVLSMNSAWRTSMTRLPFLKRSIQGSGLSWTVSHPWLFAICMISLVLMLFK